MISGFIDYLSDLLVVASSNQFGTLIFILIAATGIGIFMLLFRFIKSFNIFN